MSNIAGSIEPVRVALDATQARLYAKVIADPSAVGDIYEDGGERWRVMEEVEREWDEEGNPRIMSKDIFTSIATRIANKAGELGYGERVEICFGGACETVEVPVVELAASAESISEERKLAIMGPARINLYFLQTVVTGKIGEWAEAGRHGMAKWKDR